MKHCILDKHQVIGWDIDETLVEGPNSEKFCAYICAHPEKTHHLITFRDPDWAGMVFEELRGIVPRQRIASVNAVPQDLWSEAAMNQIITPDHPSVLANKHWKGAKAKELGCTILVDDMAHLVEEGCFENDVAFLHALLPWSMDPVGISKFLSYVLRHRPDEIGIEVDDQGWTDLDELIERAQRAGGNFDREDVLRVIETSKKARFSLSDDRTRIRAAQGHTILVNTVLERDPPALLYHGTAQRFLPSIRATGLDPRKRRHVHLTTDHATALDVGSRYGRPVALRIDVAAMVAAGLKFYLADNGVWLTDGVPPQFIHEE